MDRIISALTFKREVYAEVEHDDSFTSTAWLIVAVVSFLNALGSGSSDNILNYLLNALGGAVFAIVGFAIAAFVIDLVGRTVFRAESSFSEVVRTVGLAYVWQIFGVLGILGVFIPLLLCVVGPVRFIAWILWVISAFIAVKEALDLEWLQTIITVVLGWIAFFIVVMIGGFILAALGIAGAALFGAF
ncbi:MAG: YIP1 family protein [Chloroflexota bacterium]|nr:MAG: YIP1 family protein [Chloroflexota bacterium]